jgi:hypothetical protein
MIPALFLGTIISTTLVVALRYTSWTVVILCVVVQALALLAWWREKGKKVGVTVWLPATVWFVVLLGVDIFFSVIDTAMTSLFALVGLGLLTALAYWLWFERYQFAPEYQKRFIAQWYTAVTTLALFVWAAAGFCLFTWLRLPVWVTSPVVGIMAGLGLWVSLFGAWFVHGLGSAHKEGRPEIFWSLVVASVALFEITWALHFFPLGFFVQAYIVAAVYVVIISLLRSMIARRGFAQSEKVGLAVLTLFTVLVVFFSRWI